MRLNEIQTPNSLKEMSYDELSLLGNEMRQEIIKTVANQGGHLASNLGVVELTMALHRVFDTPCDKLVFDVGHQAYAHKLLTGRYNEFKALRTYGGISGFPKRSESVYDCFETGHASTAVSAALGIARARDLNKENYHVIALVGDGALTGGMCYEALNDAGNDKTRLIVILNDNEMSISKNVGGLARHLNAIRGSVSYRKTKSAVKKGLAKIPYIGNGIRVFMSVIKDTIKRTYTEKDGFFDALGFRYLGPVDGHNQKSLEQVLTQAKRFDEPVLVHCITQKGHGYRQAEDQPDVFHGIAPFYVESGDLKKQPKRQSYGEIAAETLLKMAHEDKRIVAITAAMQAGTGLQAFGLEHPDRLYDVGIAEQHGVTLAAGLASQGIRPYFAVYSSFLQRGYDQIFHDVCLQNLPVCFLLDRAGIGGEDGATHHGIFDIAYLRHIPGITIMAPRDKYELAAMVRWTLTQEGPCAIRYPRKSIDMADKYPYAGFEKAKWETLKDGNDAALLTFGLMIETALAVAELCHSVGISMKVVNCATIKPLDCAMLKEIAREMPFFTLEEHQVACGFGSEVTEYCVLNGLTTPLGIFGIPDTFVPHGSHDILIESLGLSAPQLFERMSEKLAEIRGQHG